MADLCRVYPDRFAVPDFVAQSRQDIARNSAEWQDLADMLTDEDSITTLADVVRFRTTGDPAAMRNYTVRLEEQYFEGFLYLSGPELFVDAGGFDGDTTEGFIRRVPEYRRVYLFEPSVANMARARQRLAGHRDIVFVETGLSDARGTLCFDPDAGSASSVQDSGVHRIDVTTLDDAIKEPVTFVKMDLEGWELRALGGARRHITEEKPKLAVAVYHKPCDFREVMRNTLEWQGDYKLYLRHYTEGWSETVLYFVP